MTETKLPNPTWIDTPGQLQRMVQRLSGAPIVAVDTESNSLYAYKEQVCLIQFSVPDADELVDPLALEDLSSLGPLFADPAVEKVFHAAEYDVICLKRDFGFTFANLFDTMVAARILGRNAVGLGSILEEEFGLTLDKRYQRADWGIRPLPPAQLAYARMDTRYLIPLRERLLEALKKTGRLALAEEDFRRLTLVEGNGRSTDSLQDSCWRISGAQDLNPRQMAVLLELCRLRDSQARSLNRPPFKVFSNSLLLIIAEGCPENMADLEALPEMSPRLAQRYGRSLLQAVQRGLNSPPLVRPPYQRPDDAYLVRLDALRTWRKETAQAMGVESDVVLPRDIMHAIAETNPRAPGDLRPIMAELPWRMERYGERIVKVLRGRA